MTDDTLALRELMEAKFAHMETRFDDLKDTFEKFTKVAVRSDRFESAMLKIRDLHALTKQTDKRINGLEKRQDKTEGQAKVFKYIGGLVVFVVIAIIIAWLKGVLGI